MEVSKELVAGLSVEMIIIKAYCTGDNEICGTV
jgi:hypothetical protein